jgi:hypothetical protein
MHTQETPNHRKQHAVCDEEECVARSNLKASNGTLRQVCRITVCRTHIRSFQSKKLPSRYSRNTVSLADRR